MCTILIMMTKPETAAWLGISPHTLMQLVKSGKGPVCIKVGKSPRFRQEDLLEWIGEDPTGELPKLLTLQEIGNEVAKTSQWARRQVLDGDLEAIRIGKQWRVTAEAHEKWKAKTIKPY